MAFHGFLSSLVLLLIWTYPIIEGLTCPSGAKQVSGVCLRYHEGKYSWSQARSYCKTNYDNDLAIVRNKGVFADIQNAVRSRSDHGFWLGGQRVGNGFSWVDKSSCCNGYWSKGEPNGGPTSGDDCVHVWNDRKSLGLNDNKCDDPIGFICEECPYITNCARRYCTDIHDVKCSSCNSNNVYYKRTNGYTKCERMCSFDNHACWPGTCSNQLTTSCTCAPGFHMEKNYTHTACKISNSPSINTCQTIIRGANKEAKRTKPGKCHDLHDFYGNFQPTSLDYDMQSDFSVNIGATTRPKYIQEENFGITDMTLIITKLSTHGSTLELHTAKPTHDTSNSRNARSPVTNDGNISLSSPKYKLSDGESLCVKYEAKGGGFVRRKDFTNNRILDPLPYEKTKDEETICYRYDSARPIHCLKTGSCVHGEKEPIQIAKRITRTPIIPLQFSGWFDPVPVGGNPIQASGIESYEIRVNEVANGTVSTSKVFEVKLSSSNRSYILNLTSESPRLYAITLEVKDVADNVQQARRFVLYDGSTNLTSGSDNPFLVSSASKSTNHMWQTHHNSICLDWRDHFFNKFYMENSLLGNIKADPHGIITGIYEQERGILPVNGTRNVFGITEFRFTWSLDGKSSNADILVPDVLQQTYCHLFTPMKDGQTYTLNINAIDIVNNTISENRTVHIDRTVPHINNIWLTKDGVKRLFVHDETDLSKMNLTFEALDPHSGLLNIEWKLSTMDTIKHLGTGVLGIAVIDEKGCPENTSRSCYCPDVGKCENFKYSIPLNKLVKNNTHLGNHNRDYMFTIKVTNNAKLSNVEQIDILVDDSPPETGVIYEGAQGTSDIDYTSDSNFMVRWHGFIDHESGIREYRLAMSDTCLTKEDILSESQNKTITERKTILYTENTVRLDANFTGRKIVSIIAINNAMGVSDVVCSDGITRDIHPSNIKNLRVQNGKWSESLVCRNGETWFLRSDMTKVRLPNTDACTKVCLNDTDGQWIIRLLPQGSIENNDTNVIDFLCDYLPFYTNDTVIYLPNDHISIGWDLRTSGSQIEGHYVGFSKSMSGKLSIMDYKSTNGKHYFQTRHIGVSSGDLFFASIKTVNKANIETESWIGPLMIDETPPIFKESPMVHIDGDTITIGWNNDTIYDLEQKERITSVIFQIVHDNEIASPLLEWTFEDSKPCPRFTGGCLMYPLKRLQKMDTDLGLNFTVRVYAYNKAGHFSLKETEPFKIPSRYPPGHAVVKDIDPERHSGGSSQDIDVHFTANKACLRWEGFYHHEQVNIEIGIGENKSSANIVPFRVTNESSSTCIRDKTLNFNTKYYFIVRASCSGGEVVSTSNGFIILNKTDLINNLIIGINDKVDDREMIVRLTTNATEQCSRYNVNVGEEYILSISNVSKNVTIDSKDFMLKERIYSSKNETLEIHVIPLIKRPCIKLLTRYNSGSVHLRKAIVNSFVSDRKGLSINIHYKEQEVLEKLKFKAALATVTGSSPVSGFVSEWKSSENAFLSFDLGSLSTTKKYAVAVTPCTKLSCLDFILSPTFHIEHTVYPGEITQSIVKVNGSDDCLDINLSWKNSTAKSGITLSQWAVSRDNAGHILLTEWFESRIDKNVMYKANKCVNLPIHGHSTLYMCVRVFTAVGNVVTNCEKATTTMVANYAIDTVYDIDVKSNKWEIIKHMMHSSHIGSELGILHDAEADFVTTDAYVAGVLLHATERNVTWYLMKSRHVPHLLDCSIDTDCVHSEINDDGFMPFHSNIIEKNHAYYICAYSNFTLIPRETVVETLPEIRSCSNGFVVDDSPPTAGAVDVANTNGFLTRLSSLKVSWSGFDDNIDVSVLGYLDRIKNYSYAIGTRSGSTDIQNYTMVGNECDVDIPPLTISDGSDVYVTVKASDQSGLTVTKSSEQMIVDTSPPSQGSVIINHANKETLFISSLECEITLTGFADLESGIDYFEVSIAMDKFSEDIISSRIYNVGHFFFRLPDGLDDGRKYYVSVKAINRAGLSTVPVIAPFIVDRSPPTGGHVLDGNTNMKRDADYQNSINHIQGHWKGFVDPHSGIKYYRVGLGTNTGDDDVEHMVNVGLWTDIAWNGTYHPGQKYYITVEACNFGELCRSISSDGVVLDNSPPIKGVVRLGSDGEHQKYLPQKGSLHIRWAGFEDPQSGIDHYEACLGTQPGVCDILPYSTCLLESSSTKTGLNLLTDIDLYASVTAYNKAGMNTMSVSDAFKIDNTPPILIQKPLFLRDVNAITGEVAQWDKSVLRLYWKFRDEESKLASHVISLKTHHEGHTPIENVHVGNVDRLTLALDERSWLHNGDTYYVVVTSCNVAGLCTSERSDNLLIDSTPPHQGGFKPPLTWQNYLDSHNTTKSNITLTWYGFLDAESSIDVYYLTVSRYYSGHELSGLIIHKASNRTEQTATINLTEEIKSDDLLVLTVWAKNNAGLNSTIAKISVSGLSSGIVLNTASGILEIQKHSCDIHYCNKDCTCAILGQQCIEIQTNETCNAINATEAADMGYPTVNVYGGMHGKPQYITASSACLSGHWIANGDETLIERYEWSMGIKEQPVGVGVFDLKAEQPWKDIGKGTQTVYCLQSIGGIVHDTDYIIYVRAWYSRHEYATFISDSIRVDQTPPHRGKGKIVKDADETCKSDLDVINWMDRISACWNGVFRENGGRIEQYTISLGTTVNGSDIYPTTDVGLQTNITLTNLTLTHGTKYFFTVTAYNDVGLHTAVTSDGFSIDMDGPVDGIVFNTIKHIDSGFQTSVDTFNISFHGFVDKYSGIRQHFVAHVESDVNDYANVSFTNIALQTRHTFKNLNLEQGKSYKGLVKVIDNAGHTGNIVASFPRMVDQTPPTPMSCERYETVNINITETSNCVKIVTNMSIHNYYLVSGRFSNLTVELLPTISIGEKTMYLPLVFNNNGSIDFRYKFASSLNGVTTIRVSPGNVELGVNVDVQLFRCSSLAETDASSKAVIVEQVGPSKVAFTSLIMDKESSLYKVHIGAGTTPGGFQIKPLTQLHDGTSSNFKVDVEHDTMVYVTILAENHAGLRSVFKAKPLRMDKTAPVISHIETAVKVSQLLNDTINSTGIDITISTTWDVQDKESGIRYCLCGLGKTVKGTDMVDFRMSNTKSSCLFNGVDFHHGDSVFSIVKCVNNIEMSTSALSNETIVSSATPDTQKAILKIFGVSASLNPMKRSDSKRSGDLQEFVQSDKTRVVMEWEGFSDPSGLKSYEYCIVHDNETLVDWTATGDENMADVKGLSLSEGEPYFVEVRAINVGSYISKPIKAGVTIHNKPTLTGKATSFVRNGQQLELDWSDVFFKDERLFCSYDVIVGSRVGFSDVIELRHIRKSRYEITLPNSTIVTPNMSEVFVAVTCTYPIGMFNVYSTNYKL